MTHRMKAVIAAGSVVLALSSHAASAQSGGASPPPATDAQGSGDLSDKLSTTNGVIHPKTNVDPAMGKAPADTGAAKMPVIRPPGSAGGPADVQPK